MNRQQKYLWIASYNQRKNGIENKKGTIKAEYRKQRTQMAKVNVEKESQKEEEKEIYMYTCAQTIHCRLQAGVPKPVTRKTDK